MATELEIIPVSEFPDFTESLILNGVSYNIGFTWNTRFEFWTMSIQDANGVELINGVKVVLNYELIASFPSRGLPDGEIWAIDLAGSNKPIGRDDLSNGRINIIFKWES